ncbi:uncharacterized protein LOC113500993 isoform X2 [Trichoplusia ni]|uniref:alpha-glucosidase n=1 Tax=Trichoplusia ni TaxID=7111 RepID=A0A7E5WC72_TRINI|nr:uncharacterized protein LOC113500993 isoform X2 [Trichoplusia ni]
MWWVLVACVIGGAAAGVVAPWWDNAVYYRIVVDSFRDDDGDGLGDLKGALKQISYVRALGADAVILSSLTAKSTDCSKPGTVDFSTIDQRYGNWDHLVGLVEKTKKLELKLVVTLPLQTVSTGSEWFVSSADRANGFEDRIIWKEGTAEEMPAPEEGIESWTWHETRKAYWASSSDEAILNLCSESLTATLSVSQCAWLKRGVSGVLLRLDFPRDQRCGEQLLRRLVADAMSCVRSAGLETP